MRNAIRDSKYGHFYSLFPATLKFIVCDFALFFGIQGSTSQEINVKIREKNEIKTQQTTTQPIKTNWSKLFQRFDGH